MQRNKDEFKNFDEKLIVRRAPSEFARRNQAGPIKSQSGST